MGSYTESGELKGMLVAELQPLNQLEGETGPVLESAPTDALAMYIISLGKHSSYIHMLYRWDNNKAAVHGGSTCVL